MNKLLDKLSVSIQPEMVEFNRIYKESLHSDVKLINTVIGYLTRKKGKRFEATFMLACCKNMWKYNSINIQGGFIDRNYSCCNTDT